MQALNRISYNEFIPKIMNYFVIERPFVHLYLANKKRFLIAYLDNYKAVEVPRDLVEPPESDEVEEHKNTRFSSLKQAQSMLVAPPAQSNQFQEALDRMERARAGTVVQPQQQ